MAQVTVVLIEFDGGEVFASLREREELLARTPLLNRFPQYIWLTIPFTVDDDFGVSVSRHGVRATIVLSDGKRYRAPKIADWVFTAGERIPGVKFDWERDIQKASAPW